MEGRDSQGVWDVHVHTAAFKMDTQQLHSTWNTTVGIVHGTYCVVDGTLLNVLWQPG